MPELWQEGKHYLEECQVTEAGLDAWLLLEYVTGVSRAVFYAHPEKTAPPDQTEEYRRLIRLRGKRIPLQHLTGEAWFMGYRFTVNEHVLIPRQDTETLAEEALKVLRQVREPRILDMCTGSGCLLVSLLLERPDASGTGADLSADALAVAQKNAEDLGCAERAVFVESDLFSHPCFSETGGNETPRYDVLVSNPPYIAEAEIGTLAPEVRLHDPRMALSGGDDGLFFYRRITERAPDYVQDGGWLLYETGCSQGEAVAGFLREKGFTEIRITKDLSGLDRVVSGRWRRLHV
ncbi:MAG: peptide chain release factor N(5)-glutamine methyltransferase [Blautia sp.]|nr:peptide chain release factor N(5)-glutamine methyltransferase [Blautia sp.]